MLPRLHLITAFPDLDKAALARVLDVISRCGVVAGTRELVVLARPFGTRVVVVDDRLDLAIAAGADYASVGPVHATTTEQGLPDPLGLDVLAATAREIPATAIGGTTAARVPAVMAAGAHGVAAVWAAVWADPDPARAGREIAELVHAA